MIKSVAVTNFQAIPYLQSSPLMMTHQGCLSFSLQKPNVIVGPNGAGKSALLAALALHTLSFYTGRSSLDANYTRGTESNTYWTHGAHSWRRECEFLPGFESESDLGPAFYYRPSHIPGNDHSVAASMMCGYFGEARAYADATDQKSSGQACKALLAQVECALSGNTSSMQYGAVNWGCGLQAKNLDERPWVGNGDIREEALKARVRGVSKDAIPLLIMDEPEQSLDAIAELELWKSIEQADCSRMQIIVATHSIYPMLRPDSFHLIEAEPGYARAVAALLK